MRPTTFGTIFKRCRAFLAGRRGTTTKSESADAPKSSSLVLSSSSLQRSLGDLPDTHEYRLVAHPGRVQRFLALGWTNTGLTHGQTVLLSRPRQPKGTTP